MNRAICACMLLLGSCTYERQIGEERSAPVWTPTNKLDVLFVIDNSGSMQPAQNELTGHFDDFARALESLPGGLPDIHIAVVSSDVGIGTELPEDIPDAGPSDAGAMKSVRSSGGACPFTAPGCVWQGDDGRFQDIPRGPCSPPSDPFIRDNILYDGSRVANYTGTLGEAFSCIARLGTSGCGLEQHFESMKRALDGHNPGNAGFVRDDALLAVIFIADEDDCSAADCAVFDPSPFFDRLDSTLGPVGSFRCTEFGLECDGDPITRGAGTYSSCEPRRDSYIWHPQHYVDFLRTLKPDPNRLFVAAIAGTPAPVTVALNENTREPELQPSCQVASRDAPDGGVPPMISGFPGVRFDWFIRQFGDRGAFVSICSTYWDEVIRDLGNKVRSALDHPSQPAPDPPPPGGCSVAVGP